MEEFALRAFEFCVYFTTFNGLKSQINRESLPQYLESNYVRRITRSTMYEKVPFY